MTKAEMNRRIANRFRLQHHFTMNRMPHWKVEAWEVTIVTANFRHWFPQRNQSVAARRISKSTIQTIRNLRNAT